MCRAFRSAALVAVPLSFIAPAMLGTLPSAAAESPPAVTGVIQLSLEDAVARAVDHGPEVTLARHAVREASATRVGAGIVMPVNPRLSFEMRPAITGGTLHDTGYGAILDFLFEIGGAPAARVREADRRTDVALAQLEVVQLDARLEAWSTYLRAKIAEARVVETERAVLVAQRVMDASKQRADLGASGDIEKSLASSELGQLEASLVDARRGREALEMALRNVLDLEAGQRMALTTTIEEPGPVPDAGALVERAVKDRPELALIARRMRLLDATEQRLSRETFPRTGIYAGVDAAPVSPIFGQLGLSLELPFAQRNQGPRAVVEAARNSEVDRQVLETRRIVREVIAARAAYEARRVELRRLTDDALPNAERTYELVETGWRSGRFDLFSVTTAARDLVRVRGLRLDALEAAWLDRALLDRAVGRRYSRGGGQ